MFGAYGRSRIDKALAKVEGFAVELELGAQEARALITSHETQIANSYVEIDELHDAASRGEAVAGRLRDLIA